MLFLMKKLYAIVLYCFSKTLSIYNNLFPMTSEIWVLQMQADQQ